MRNRENRIPIAEIGNVTISNIRKLFKSVKKININEDKNIEASMNCKFTP